MPKPEITVRDTVLRRKIGEFLRKINKPLIKDLTLYSGWFVQSAIKATGPKKKTSNNRDVLLVHTKRYNKNKNEIKRYKVPFRQTNKKGRRFFKKIGEAKKFAKIKYRFISKYAWLASFENILRKPLKVKMSKVGEAVKRIKRQIGKGRRVFNVNNPYVTLINSVDKISKYASVAAHLAMGRTENRISKSSNKKRVKKNYKKLWGK